MSGRGKDLVSTSLHNELLGCLTMGISTDMFLGFPTIIWVPLVLPLAPAVVLVPSSAPERSLPGHCTLHLGKSRGLCFSKRELCSFEAISLSTREPKTALVTSLFWMLPTRQTKSS
jgi:hypothetical protein